MLDIGLLVNTLSYKTLINHISVSNLAKMEIEKQHKPAFRTLGIPCNMFSKKYLLDINRIGIEEQETDKEVGWHIHA